VLNHVRRLLFIPAKTHNGNHEDQNEDQASGDEAEYESKNSTEYLQRSVGPGISWVGVVDTARCDFAVAEAVFTSAICRMRGGEG
jgi:hypothetical protein